MARMIAKKYRIIIFFLSLLISSSIIATSLLEAVNHTLNTNPDVLADQAVEQAANSGLTEAKAGMLPTIDANWGRGREYSDTSTLTDNKRWLTRYESGIQLTYPVFEGGRTINTIKQRKSELNSAKYSLNSSQEITALDAISSYLDVLREQRLLDLAKDNQSIHEVFLSQIEQRFSGGAGHIGDIDLTKARYALAKSRVIKSEADLESSKARYVAVVGEDPKQLTEPTAPIKQIPASLDEAYAIAEKNSPALRATEANLIAARAAMNAQKADFLPTVNFEAGVTRNRNLDGTEGQNRDKQIMVRASYNLFSGGAKVARIEQVQHQYTEAQQNVLSAKRQVRENVALAWHNYTKAKLNLSKQQEYADATKRVVESYKEQFTIGKRLLLNVLDAENEHYGAIVQLTQSEYELKNSIYTLLSTEGVLVTTVQNPSINKNQLSNFRANPPSPKAATPKQTKSTAPTKQETANAQQKPNKTHTSTLSHQPSKANETNTTKTDKPLDPAAKQARKKATVSKPSELPGDSHNKTTQPTKPKDDELSGSSDKAPTTTTPPQPATQKPDLTKLNGPAAKLARQAESKPAAKAKSVETPKAIAKPKAKVTAKPKAQPKKTAKTAKPKLNGPAAKLARQAESKPAAKAKSVETPKTTAKPKAKVTAKPKAQPKKTAKTAKPKLNGPAAKLARKADNKPVAKTKSVETPKTTAKPKAQPKKTAKPKLNGPAAKLARKADHKPSAKAVEKTKPVKTEAVKPAAAAKPQPKTITKTNKPKLNGPAAKLARKAESKPAAKAVEKTKPVKTEAVKPAAAAKPQPKTITKTNKPKLNGPAAKLARKADNKPAAKAKSVETPKAIAKPKAKVTAKPKAQPKQTAKTAKPKLNGPAAKLARQAESKPAAKAKSVETPKTTAKPKAKVTAKPKAQPKQTAKTTQPKLNGPAAKLARKADHKPVAKTKSVETPKTTAKPKAKVTAKHKPKPTELTKQTHTNELNELFSTWGELPTQYIHPVNTSAPAAPPKKQTR